MNTIILGDNGHPYFTVFSKLPEQNVAVIRIHDASNIKNLELQFDLRALPQLMEALDQLQRQVEQKLK